MELLNCAIGGTMIHLDPTLAGDASFGRVIRNTSFIENHADRAGGAIYLNALHLGLVAGCRLNGDAFSPERGYHASGAKCRKMKRNTIGEGGYGAAIATGPQHLALDVVYSNQTDHIRSGGYYTIRNWKSGKELPKFRLIMLDAFLQAGAMRSPAYGRDLHSSEGISLLDTARIEPVVGQLLPNRITESVANGSKDINIGVPFQKPSSYALQVSLAGNQSEQTTTVYVVLRACIINEKANENNTQCVTCDATQYNFVPAATTCTNCPDDGNCSSAFVLPKRGYWNASPCAHHIQRCININACKGSNDTEVNEELGHLPTDCNFSESFQEWYNASLCEDGYASLLCGSCKDSSGKIGFFTCRACLRSVYDAVFVALSVLIVMGLVVLQIKGNLDTVKHWTRRQLTMIDKQMTRKRLDRSRRASKEGGWPNGARQVDSTRRRACTQEEKNRFRQKECMAKWKFVEVLKV